VNSKTRVRWDNFYQGADSVPAMRVVAENLHLLPRSGNGLELACGLAANAFMLAEHGLRMDAWDISPVVVERINQAASQRNLPVSGKACDLDREPLPVSRYDVVVVTHFLDRDLVQPIIAALKPGGILMYQTFTRTRVSAGGPENELFRLADGELLSLFSDLQPRVYREEGLCGDSTQGFRNEALLVAQKPAD